MWDTDPDYLRVGPAVTSLVDHKVKVSVVGFSVNYREDKKGGESTPQAHFRITNIVDLGLDTGE